jgi:TetR/AcrR family transcriptional repressor of nem operon
MTIVMRPTHKAETRQRILDAASPLFRGHGVDAVGVDAVMRAAGLTHGGFYAHFPSKEALVAEVCATSLARAASRWERISQGEGRMTDQAPAPDEGNPAALAQIVESYLDPTRLDAIEHGCVLSALGPEVARRPAVRPGLADSLGRMLGALERCLPRGLPDQRRRERALAALSTMVGAVVLARLSSDQRMATSFLMAAKEAVLSDADATPKTRTRLPAHTPLARHRET